MCLSHLSVVGTFKNDVLLVTQEKGCDLDSAGKLEYLRAKIVTETHSCYQKHASVTA
jgi:hypothetical protein